MILLQQNFELQSNEFIYTMVSKKSIILGNFPRLHKLMHYTIQIIDLFFNILDQTSVYAYFVDGKFSQV